MAILAASTEDSISIIIWVLVLVALLVPLAAATLWLRKWAHQEADEGPAVGFMLHDVQQMLKRGEIDQAQYERLRQEIIAQSRRALDAKSKPREAKDENKG